jgi:hypothetical protein
MTGRLITLGLIAACWPIWWCAEWLAERVGLDDLDPLSPFLILILSLCVAEHVITRVLRHAP